MKSLYFFIIVLFLFVNCDKALDHKELYLRGRLFLTDNITKEIDNSPLANKIVYLSVDEHDSLNYLLNDTTDANGYFAFHLLPSFEDSLVLRYNETSGGVKYTAKIITIKGDEKVELHAYVDQKQNGFVVQVKDSLGGLIPNANIKLYNSPVLAALDSPIGAMETLTSDLSGKAYRLNIPPGLYYLNASKTIDNTITYHRIMKPLQVQSQGIVYSDSIMLRKK